MHLAVLSDHFAVHMSVFRRPVRTVLVLFVALGTVGAAHAQSGGAVEVGADGIRLTSPDEAFELRFRSDLYIDARMLPGTDAAPGSDRLYLRRVRPRLQGRVYERFAFSVRPD